MENTVINEAIMTSLEESFQASLIPIDLAVNVRKVFLSDVNAAIDLYQKGSSSVIDQDFGIPIYLAETNGRKVASLSLCFNPEDQNQIITVIRSHKGFEKSFETMLVKVKGLASAELVRRFGFEDEKAFNNALWRLINWLNA